MTDRTPNRGYIYPECDPPLVKDRSDIAFMQELAQQVDADAGGLDIKIVTLLEKPDAARIAYNGPITVAGITGTAGSLFLIPYNVTTYDNTAGSTDLVAGGLRVRERGWYMFTSSMRCTNGGAQDSLIRHMRNNLTYQEGRRLEGPSATINGNEENMATSDILLCQVGDLVQTQVKFNNANGTFTFECRLSMVQLLPLDV